MLTLTRAGSLTICQNWRTSSSGSGRGTEARVLFSVSITPSRISPPKELAKAE